MDKTFYEQLVSEEKRLIELLDAVRKLKNSYSPAKIAFHQVTIADTERASTPVVKKYKSGEKPYYTAIEKTPNVFNNNFSHIQKVFYCLRAINRGMVDEVTHTITGHDKHISQETARKAATYHLSKFYRLGLIGADKEGNKNVYYIK